MADLVVTTENLRNFANQLATVHGTLTAADGDAQRRHSHAQRSLTEARQATQQTVDPGELAEATDAARR